MIWTIVAASSVPLFALLFHLLTARLARKIDPKTAEAEA